MLAAVLGCKSSDGLPATRDATGFLGVLELTMASPRRHDLPAVLREKS
jgi:hypothetical protein